MVHFVGLDLSIKSTGWASWREGQDRPVSGIWKLAEGLEWAPRAFLRLHQNLMDLHRTEPIDSILYEEPLNMAMLNRANNPAIPQALIGLASHVDSFAEAIGCKVRQTHQATWRRHFIGAMKRGTKKVDLKRMAMIRCRELGFEPAKDDEAEALGVLDFEIYLAGITPPWRMQNVLVEQFAGGARP